MSCFVISSGLERILYVMFMVYGQIWIMNWMANNIGFVARMIVWS